MRPFTSVAQQIADILTIFMALRLQEVAGCSTGIFFVGE
jgi:hypothetical protein